LTKIQKQNLIKKFGISITQQAIEQIQREDGQGYINNTKTMSEIPDCSCDICEICRKTINTQVNEIEHSLSGNRQRNGNGNLRLSQVPLVPMPVEDATQALAVVQVQL
jgi:hypothetical protein